MILLDTTLEKSTKETYQESYYFYSFDLDIKTQYNKDIGQLRLLSEDEIIILYKRIEDGDKLAKNEVVVHNLRLVAKCAKSIKRRYGTDLSIMDLIQAGNIGLMKAVEKFDYKQGYAFSTYAFWWIKQSVVRHIHDMSSNIRIPIHMNERFMLISKAIRGFIENNGRNPSFKEIQAELRISIYDYNYYILFDKATSSLNVSVGEDHEKELLDVISSNDSFDPVYELTEKNLTKQIISECLDKLSERERIVLQKRFGFDDGKPKTLDFIGCHFGVSRERIRQIELKAIKKLQCSTRLIKLQFCK